MDIMTADTETGIFLFHHDHNRIQPGGINTSWSNYVKRSVYKMVKIDIISGFLGAGKTTLIKKLLKDGFQGEQVVLIENEFGEIGIDGGFLKEAGIQIREMNS